MRTKIKKLIFILGHRLYKIVKRPIKLYWKVCNIHTQGVRVMLVYKGEILLVRHWYNSLWVMPGGGIKKHETPEQAAIREVKEETGVIVEQLDYLLGIYSNTKEDKKDTVYCFVVELKDKPIPQKQRFNIEIADKIWGTFDNLPKHTSKATQDRIFEYINKNVSKLIRPW